MRNNVLCLSLKTFCYFSLENKSLDVGLTFRIHFVSKIINSNTKRDGVRQKFININVENDFHARKILTSKTKKGITSNKIRVINVDNDTVNNNAGLSAGGCSVLPSVTNLRSSFPSVLLVIAGWFRMTLTWFLPWTKIIKQRRN